MFFREQASRYTEGIRKSGRRQGMWTTLLITSPFIVAGLKWMSDHRQPMMERMSEWKGDKIEGNVQSEEENADNGHESKSNYSNDDVISDLIEELTEEKTDEKQK